ncbi:MAG: hypothetical protein HY648_13605 [Acidobacteria bacterium]|nr:hypothetical protein [Acidobacteriota bacterium]
MVIHLAGPAAKHVRETERGYVLLVFVLFTALLVIGFSRVLPTALFQGQREKEEELIFRGQQYQRAIQLFVRKFGRYPNSLEELENTNNIRFLRSRYRDPITREGEWRLIHIGPGGVFPDSLTVAQPAQASTGLEPSPEMYRRPEGAESGGAAPRTAGSAGFAPINPGGLSGGTAAGESSEPAMRPSSDPTANPQVQPRAAATAQGGPPPLAFGSGGIAGVASQNTGESIKVWNGYSQYNEWEFIYDFRGDPIGTAAILRTTAPAAQPAGQPAAPAGPPPTTPRPLPDTQQPSPQTPQWLGAPPPGVRPGEFPPSPIPPRSSPRPRQQ